MADAEGRQAAKRAYTPRRNSVPYAFVICMMRGHQEGKAFFEKQELMQLAEDSGLSHTPVFAAAEVTNQSFSYDGWACMKTLTQKGLVERGGRPVRVSLTPEGKAVAARLMAELDGGDVAPHAAYGGEHYGEASGETQHAQPAQHAPSKKAAASGGRKRKESAKRPAEVDSDDDAADSEEDWEPGKKRKTAKKGGKKKKKKIDDDDDDDDEEY